MYMRSIKSEFLERWAKGTIVHPYSADTSWSPIGSKPIAICRKQLQTSACYWESKYRKTLHSQQTIFIQNCDHHSASCDNYVLMTCMRCVNAAQRNQTCFITVVLGSCDCTFHNIFAYDGMWCFARDIVTFSKLSFYMRCHRTFVFVFECCLHSQLFE